MITMPLKEVEKRAYRLLEILEKKELTAKLFVRECQSQIGGGSLPMERLESRGVCISPLSISTTVLEARLRHTSPPIIGRIVNDEILLDVRTVGDEQLELIGTVLKEALI
jgi:Selenocysteine synthase [seryl-tRNASer selenium transferase]